MNFNFQKARELMVENQLRPNKINNPTILELFKNIKKEDFILFTDLGIMNQLSYMKVF